MAIPATIISGASLMDRWSMTGKGILLMMIQHKLRLMISSSAMFPYEPMTPDDSLIWVTGYGSEDFPRKVIEVANYQFNLEDVRRVEAENQEIFGNRPSVLTIDQIINRWGKTIEETLDMLNTAGIASVDPIGRYFHPDDLIYYMDAHQYIDESYLMYREDDIKALESRYPDQVLQADDEIPRPVIELMKEAKPEIEMIYTAIKDQGLTGTVDKLKEAALDAFDASARNCDVIRRKYLEVQEIYIMNTGQEPRDFKGKLLKLIVKDNKLGYYGGQRLYKHYCKLPD